MLGEVRALRAVDAKWAFEEDASVSAELVPDPAHSREYVALAKHHNQHCAWNIGQVVPLSDRQVVESTVRDPSAAWLLNMTEDAAKECFRIAVSQIAIQQGPPASHCITAAYDSGFPRDAINMMGKLTCAILEANAYAMAHIDLAATARPISSPAPSTPLAPLSSPALSGPPTPIASSPLSGPLAPIAIPQYPIPSAGDLQWSCGHGEGQAGGFIRALGSPRLACLRLRCARRGSVIFQIVRVVHFGIVAEMRGEVRALRAGDAKWAFDEDAGDDAEVANGELYRCRRTGRVPEFGL